MASRLFPNTLLVKLFFHIFHYFTWLIIDTMIYSCCLLNSYSFKKLIAYGVFVCSSVSVDVPVLQLELEFHFNNLHNKGFL